MTVEAKEKELADLNKKLVKTAEEELYIDDKNNTDKNNVQDSMLELNMLQEEHKFELLTQAQYQHVLARMKKDLIAS